MRVQCDVCEKALAELVCCADEAALCRSCDQRIHAANKLASKHQRLRLLHNLPDTSNALPLCDICQEKGAFIFCLEDRALVCRNCDVCIHAANTLAAGHQRFLATGVQVALESEQPAADGGSHPSKPEAPLPQPPSSTAPAANSGCPSYSSSCQLPSAQESGNLVSATKPMEEWQGTQCLELEELASGYRLADIDFSKSELPVLGDQDWLTDLCGFNESLYADSLAEVPQASIPTFSVPAPRLESSTKSKQRRDGSGTTQDFDSISVVPDFRPFTTYGPLFKRQKSLSGI